MDQGKLKKSTTKFEAIGIRTHTSVGGVESPDVPGEARHHQTEVPMQTQSNRGGSIKCWKGGDEIGFEVAGLSLRVANTVALLLATGWFLSRATDFALAICRLLGKGP